MLSGNGFTGQIPDAIGSLTSLEHLVLFSNALAGPIPASLWNLTNLKSLVLSGKQLTGSLPSAVEGPENRERLQVKLGALVLAHWESAGAYFVGTVVEERECDGGLLIVFENGNIGIIDSARVTTLKELGPGSRVFARWRDGVYYPGRIDRIVGRALYIIYDDDDGCWMPWSAIRVESI